MFQTVPLSIIRSISLYTQQRSMLYKFAYSLQAGSGWNCSSILILLASCLQTGVIYTIAVYTVKYSWWWTQELSETCRVSLQNKIKKLVYLVGFIIQNLVKNLGFFWFLNFFYRTPIHISQNTSVLRKIVRKRCSTLNIRQATEGKLKTSYQTE
jgi:hypothetical protein